MYRKEVNVQSPLRVLETSINGGLGKGNLGVVMARAGVGKTAALVQIGLDDLMRNRPVLHIALGQTVEYVLRRYDALFDDMATRTNLEERDVVAAAVAAKRIIAAFPDNELGPERLQRTVELFKQNLDFKPAAVLVDEFAWSTNTVAETAALIGAFKAYAKLIDAELWMTAQTRREVTGVHPTGLTPPCADYAELIDVAIFLEPHKSDVTVRLLKDHGDATPTATPLHLHPQTMRLIAAGEALTGAELTPSAYTLLSGGAKGAEAEFGRCAEHWGLCEQTYSFPGRHPERSRGLVNLSEEELAEGAVSPVYIAARMKRRYPDTPLFHKTLQSIWHQVQTAGEVFVVGMLQADDTIKGGTGWAAELGRHWAKPVFVFDQVRCVWLSWVDGAWLEVDRPVVTRPRFTGSGTRELNEAGRAAIAELFERSFGPAPGEVNR